jgi:hypothetical protein
MTPGSAERPKLRLYQYALRCILQAQAQLYAILAGALVNAVYD